MAFERVSPVRGFCSFRGQRNRPGLWWFSSTGEQVGHESWLERDRLIEPPRVFRTVELVPGCRGTAEEVEKLSGSAITAAAGRAPESMQLPIRSRADSGHDRGGCHNAGPRGNQRLCPLS